MTSIAAGGPKRPRFIPFLIAVAMMPCIGLAASGAPGSPAEGGGYPAFAGIQGEGGVAPYAAMSSASGSDLQDLAYGMQGRDFGAEHPRGPGSLPDGIAPLEGRLDEIRRAAAAATSLSVRPGLVTMTGEGSVRVVPDAAVLRFGIVTDDEKASGAMTRNAGTSRSIMDALLKAGLKSQEISSDQISLHTLPPQPHDIAKDPADRPKPRYRAQNHVVVEVGGLHDKIPAFLGDLIGSAVEAGATEVSGPVFRVLDDARAATAARKAAVDDAMVKAATYAHALGGKLGRIVQVREGGDERDGMPIIAMKAMAAPAVSSGTREVSARVTVVWEVRQ